MESTTQNSVCTSILQHDARVLSEVIKPDSVDLVVTSPPYPMISMWDDLFRTLDPSIPPSDEWKDHDANVIFEKMHVQLDQVWTQLAVCVSNREGLWLLTWETLHEAFNGTFVSFPMQPEPRWAY